MIAQYLSEQYFRMADDAALMGNIKLSDHYWRLGCQCENAG